MRLMSLYLIPFSLIIRSSSDISFLTVWLIWRRRLESLSFFSETSDSSSPWDSSVASVGGECACVRKGFSWCPSTINCAIAFKTSASSKESVWDFTNSTGSNLGALWTEGVFAHGPISRSLKRATRLKVNNDPCTVNRRQPKEPSDNFVRYST